MNTELIKKLIKIVECDKRWHQGAWYGRRTFDGDAISIMSALCYRTPADMLHDCGTCACVAGWTLALDKDARHVLIDSFEVQCKARRLLDIGYDIADMLFSPIRTKTEVLAILNMLLDGKSDNEITKEIYEL